MPWQFWAIFGVIVGLPTVFWGLFIHRVYVKEGVGAILFVTVMVYLLSGKVAND
jgi:hypothetical protein